MKYTKVRNVKDPQRANPGDAGIDFFIPPFNEKFLHDLRIKNPLSGYQLLYQKYEIYTYVPVIVLPPNERILIPSGIHVQLPKGTCMQAMNKSGIANNFGLDRLAELVDESYQGEVHISLVNTSNNLVLLREGMKIIQFVISKYEADIPELVPGLLELYPEETKRGQGGFGSSGV